MRFARIDNKLVEAEPGLEGLCPGCSQFVIAKCGKQRIHHWAHRNNKMCDSWHEPETEWYRAWKNNFPASWQEIFLLDEVTGEKHIADVRTSHGLVIEFQHSHIALQERAIRENFYQNMVWGVDGTRLKRDYPRFLRGREDCFRNTGLPGFFFVNFPDKCFPSAWLESLVPVIFDFRGSMPTEPQDLARDTLWCLLPGRAEGYAVCAAIACTVFVDRILNYPSLFPSPDHELVSAFADNIRQEWQQLHEMRNTQFDQHLRKGRRHFRL